MDNEITKEIMLEDIEKLYEKCEKTFNEMEIKRVIYPEGMTPSNRGENESNVENFMFNEVIKSRIKDRKEILIDASGYIVDKLYSDLASRRQMYFKKYHNATRFIDEGQFFLENDDFKIETLFPTIPSFMLPSVLFTKDFDKDMGEIYNLYFNSNPLTTDAMLAGVEPYKVESNFVYYLNDNIICIKITTKRTKVPVRLYISAPIKSAPGLERPKTGDISTAFDITSIIGDICHKTKNKQYQNMFASLAHLLGMLDDIISTDNDEVLKMFENEYKFILIRTVS